MSQADRNDYFQRGVIRANSKTGGFAATLEVTKKIAAMIEKKGANALNNQADRVFKESQRLVPVDTGALKASGRVVYASSDNPVAKIEYPVWYAVYVHEIPDPPHAHEPPTSWKFLEFAVRNVWSELHQIAVDEFGDVAMRGGYSFTFEGEGPQTSSGGEE